MKLGMMLEVDETFTTIWLSIIRGQGQGQEMTSVPLGTIYLYHKLILNYVQHD